MYEQKDACEAQSVFFNLVQLFNCMRSKD